MGLRSQQLSWYRGGVWSQDLEYSDEEEEEEDEEETGGRRSRRRGNKYQSHLLVEVTCQAGGGASVTGQRA